MVEKTPSFKGLKPASELASKSKSSNRRADTKHEVLLRSVLWRMGLRFRKNVKDLPGEPDIVFPRARLAIFCDGDFWHGRDWKVRRAKLERGTNPDCWIAKIETNIARDVRTTKALEEAGWQVMRFWETDIKKNVTQIAERIEQVVREQTPL